MESDMNELEYLLRRRNVHSNRDKQELCAVRKVDVEEKHVAAKSNDNARNNGQKQMKKEEDEKKSDSPNILVEIQSNSNNVETGNDKHEIIEMETIKQTNIDSKTNNQRMVDIGILHQNQQCTTNAIADIAPSSDPILEYAAEPLLPLVKACAPLSDIIHDIAFYVELALKETPEKPPDGLTVDESAAIRLYTIEWSGGHRSLYSMLNFTLKNASRENLRPYFKYMKLFITALVKLPCVPPVTVWRGVTKDLSAEFPPGTPVTWWAFSSCTTELTVLENNMYLGNEGSRTLFSVEAINGRTVREHSHFVTEDELLLLPGTHMIVQSQFSPASDLHIIHLKQVIPDEVLLEPPFEGACLYPKIERPWYRKKRFAIPICLLSLLVIAAVAIGAVLGTKSSRNILGPTCNDGVKNGDETDVDCGGSCAVQKKCADLKRCLNSYDCISSVCTVNLCQVPTCNDGVTNGNETDADCGGPCLPVKQCHDGLRCSNASDCVSSVCTSGFCQVSTCNDGVRNGDETGIDCGGSCASQKKCADYIGCFNSLDCINGICTANLCQVPTCNDGVMNGNETDVDCGGPCLPAKQCRDGLRCSNASDCVSSVCTSGFCQVPTCNDGVKNGDEIDIDCGGSCLPGKQCVDGSRFAKVSSVTYNVTNSNVYTSVPTCNDHVKNGDEIDVDCGGSCLPAKQCGDGLKCNNASDCISGVCISSVCQVPNCNDGVANGNETDIDCGGSCHSIKKCNDGEKCNGVLDCNSGVCTSNICQTPTCNDSVKNGNETGIDCGGWCASQNKCVDNAVCRNPDDCISGVCKSDICQIPTCNDGVMNGNEGDVDCGAVCLPLKPCTDLSRCRIGFDCKSGVCTSNLCQIPTCNDGVKNADETDIDCGGSCVPNKRCGELLKCINPSDCKSGICISNVCQGKFNAEQHDEYN
ncbi:unnamed protein product [Adineta ricciae]|uniref:NAD(P)(+)--arginine ADP-ribosyltransferase n=1 Tax=Adineta ricciae TaxID=249248 RepID=A0A814VLN7_ADIRI|nr:unnamed protein product [Adineta ricciae]CAF1189955.1 unnamed protein product [Adineta ricciae]